MSGFLGSRPQTSGLLALLCLGLGGLIYLQLDEPPLSREARSMPTAGAVGKVTQDEAIEVEFEMPPLSVFAEITTRPLFSPSRRPAPPSETPASEPDAPPPELDQFLLRGVAIAGGERVALLERRGSGELVRVLEGQNLDGWRIATIRPDEVALLDGDREVVLEIEQDKSPPTPARRVGRRGETPPAGEMPPAPWLAAEPQPEAGIPPEDETEYETEFETEDGEFDPATH